MTAVTQARQPAGAPTGGQFATAARTEPGLALAVASGSREAAVREHDRAVATERLTALATELNVDPVDLDDTVRDVTDQMASDMVNGSDEDLEDAQDRHYGEMDGHASSVNNGGLRCQVEFLVEQLGVDRTEATLRGLATANAADEALPRSRKETR